MMGWFIWRDLCLLALWKRLGALRGLSSAGRIGGLRFQRRMRRKNLQTGNSVSVSGVCLTALDIKPGSFCADLAPETWVRTSFSRIHEGALVNLELPMKADGRFGGHIVQGHVDGVGKLIAFDRIAESENWWLDIEMPEEVAKYTVYKGSISIEGISLTVAKLEERPMHDRDHSAYRRDDESAFAEGGGSGEPGSGSDCEVCGEDDAGGCGEFFDGRGFGAAGVLGQLPIVSRAPQGLKPERKKDLLS